jgi:DNA helicase-2/ATP-dependent DNA helicase PcrA
VIDGAGAAELLDGLTGAQRAAVLSDAAPLCIVASAGAGKTRVLTRRIAYRCRTGGADAAHTLALTFTRKAAGELHHRLAGLGLRGGVAAGTFHSHAAAQLQRWWADRRVAAPALLDRKSRVLGPLVDGRPGLDGVALSEVAGLIEWAKARVVAPEDLEAAVGSLGRRLPAGVDPAAVAGVYARYEDEKRRRGLVDFDDLLARCAEALERDPAFAGAQRWRWRHVYVDEFQDLNPLQHRLLLAWLGPSVDLCVVGDPNQAIYGWNGADPGLLESFPARWPSAEVLRLDANHRSSEPIVRAAAAVLGPEGARLTGVDRTGPLPTVRGCESDRAEAEEVAKSLRDARREGRRWSDMAVLTRTNAQLVVIEEVLTLAGIPCWSAASSALLDEPAVRAVLGDMRAAVRAGRRAPLGVALADLREMAREAGSAGGTGEAESAVALSALIDTGTSLLAARPDATVEDWLAWLPATVRDRSDRVGAADSVTLCTFHRAKGLEWEMVWIAGVEEGLVPMGRAQPEPALREERRLLYVGLTRAVDELHVSWSASRSFGGRPVPRQPSRWLDAVVTELERLSATGGRAGGEVPPAVQLAGVRLGDPVGTGAGAAPGGPGAQAWRSRLADQRAALRESATRAGRPLGRRTPEHWPAADAHLRQSLLRWRLEAARASGVPPKVLLHDVTVEALAALRPRTMDELLAIPGFGAVKAGRYGATLLDIVTDRAQSA